MTQFSERAPSAPPVSTFQASEPGVRPPGQEHSHYLPTSSRGGLQLPIDIQTQSNAFTPRLGSFQMNQPPPRAPSVPPVSSRPPQPTGPAFRPPAPNWSQSEAPPRSGPLQWQELVLCNNVDASALQVSSASAANRDPNMSAPPSRSPSPPVPIPARLSQTVDILNSTSGTASTASQGTGSQSMSTSDLFQLDFGETASSPPAAPIFSSSSNTAMSFGSGEQPADDGGAGGEANEVGDKETGDGIDKGSEDNGQQATQPSGSTVNPLRAMGVPEKSLARVTADLKRKKLNEGIARFLEEQEEQIVAKAEELDVSVDQFKKLMGTSKHHRKKRAVSAWDAVMHAKTQELNAGLAKGQCATIEEIREAVYQDRDLMKAYKHKNEKLQTLITDVQDHRDSKMEVARASNKTASNRATKFLKSLNTEVSSWLLLLKLALRDSSDIAGFGFFVRGSFESSIKPTLISQGPCLEFFQKYFKREPWEMLCLFEAFVTTEQKRHGKELSNNQKASKIADIIRDQLHTTHNAEKVRMNYVSYRMDIVAKYGIEIRGWPTNVDFKSPHEIKDPIQLNALFDAWTSGAAYWAVLTRREHNAVLQSIERDLNAGIQVKAPRKKRSDVGGTHNSKKRKSAGKSPADSNPKPPRKKQRTGATSNKNRRARGGGGRSDAEDEDGSEDEGDYTNGESEGEGNVDGTEGDD
ncbi:hypothetical protein GYMLUDRAFT_52584 [Collybiopsis luxurians FD-317 M1]|nr:hypothetical protein GYMLUDRAFT_52584 [Collybiopsis luxurians FD-317 M1]